MPRALFSGVDEPKPGELCKPCREARAVERYHGTPAKYCERCRSLQEGAVLKPAELSRHMQRLLFKARRNIGDFLVLHRAEAQVAQALDRRGLGVYRRTDDALTFKLTEEGQRVADALA